MIEYASIWSQEPTKQIPQLFYVGKLGKRPRPFFLNAENQTFSIQSQTMLMGYQKKRIDSLISENIILTLFTAPVARYWSFSQKTLIFCFFQNRLVGYQKKRIDSLNKDNTMLQHGNACCMHAISDYPQITGNIQVWFLNKPCS